MKTVIEPLHRISSALMEEPWLRALEDGLSAEAILGSTMNETLKEAQFLSDDLDQTTPCFDIEDRKVRTSLIFRSNVLFLTV